MKIVAQTLLTYTMSVFLLPLQIVQDLERMFAKFWWGSSMSSNKRIHWMSWPRMCRHKSTGGLGFRDLRDFNMAMLGKQAWRFLTKPNSSQLYKAR